MKIRFVFLTIIFLVTCHLGLSENEKKITMEYLETTLMFSGPHDELELRKLVRENMHLLEDVIFNGKIRDCIPRTKALAFLSIFAREKNFPREKFFDIACRYLKNFKNISSANDEIAEFGQIHGRVIFFGFDSLRNIHHIPVFETFQAFLMFVNSLNKYEMILDKTFPQRVEDCLRETQKVMETQKEQGKDFAIQKMNAISEEIQKFEKNGMDAYTFIILKKFWLNLIAQLKDSKF